MTEFFLELFVYLLFMFCGMVLGTVLGLSTWDYLTAYRERVREAAKHRSE